MSFILVSISQTIEEIACLNATALSELYDKTFSL